MKIGVLIAEKTPDLYQGIADAASWGVDGVQFYVKTHSYDLLKADSGELARLRRHLSSHSLELPAICGELSGHGFQREEEIPGNLEAFTKILHIAECLETPVVSTHIGVIPSDCNSPVYSSMLKAVSQMGCLAQKSGVTIAIETGPELPYVLRNFIEKTDGGVGVNLDPGNLVMVHNIDAYTAALELQGMIPHTHVKDGIHYQPCDPSEVYGAFADGGFDALVARTGEIFREVPLGEGQVNIPRYLSALKQIGYDGYLTIEREVTEDFAGDVQKAMAFLQKSLAAI